MTNLNKKQEACIEGIREEIKGIISVINFRLINIDMLLKSLEDLGKEDDKIQGKGKGL